MLLPVCLNVAREITAEHRGVDVRTGTGRRPGPGDAYTTKDPVIRCTADDAYCMGMYVRPKVLGKSAYYYYTMTRPPNDYNGMTGEYTMQVTSPTTDVDRGDVVRYETYVVVGNRDRVGSTIRHLHRAIG